MSGRPFLAYLMCVLFAIIHWSRGNHEQVSMYVAAILIIIALAPERLK